MKKLLIPILILAFFHTSYSGVNLKNGNFYISYTDVIIKDSLWKDLEITRTYNSKSIYNGPFGFGWGYLFDTYLVITPEFSLAIKNHGAGGTSFFESEQTNDENIQINIDLIIDAAYKAGNISNPEQEIKLTNKLISSMSNRLKYFTKYRKTGLLDSVGHQIEMIYYSQGCGCIGEVKPGYSYIISTENGYKYFDYQYNNIFTFNTIGKMTGLASMKNPENYWTISYNDKNQIERVDSYTGDWLSFKSDSLNRIVEISSSQSTSVAKFKYKGLKMITCKDVANNYYKFAYDKSYYMTKVIYNPIRLKGSPEDAMHMIYEPKTGFISKIIERDSSFTTYNYLDVSADEYGINVVNYEKDSTITKDITEWWFIKANDHGKRWTYKKVNIVNGDTITRAFHEISRKPLMVATPLDTYYFTYDPTGLLLNAKASLTDSLIVNYDENKDISSIQYLNTKFELIKDEKGYSKLILPEKKQIDLPIKDFNQPEIINYKDQLQEIKKMFDLSYYKIL